MLGQQYAITMLALSYMVQRQSEGSITLDADGVPVAYLREPYAVKGVISMAKEAIQPHSGTITRNSGNLIFYSLASLKQADSKGNGDVITVEDRDYIITGITSYKTHGNYYKYTLQQRTKEVTR